MKIKTVLDFFIKAQIILVINFFLNFSKLRKQYNLKGGNLSQKGFSKLVNESFLKLISIAPKLGVLIITKLTYNKGVLNCEMLIVFR